MYCILNMGWTPSQYMNLPQRERAIVIASIKKKIKDEEEQNKKLKASKAKRRRR